LIELENIINQCSKLQEIQAAKSLILTYIFSMKKENRNLHRRINDKQADSNNLNGLGVVGMEKY